MSLLPIIGVDPSRLPEAAVVVGDPARAERASSLLEEPRLLGRNREYVTYTGGFRGETVAISSHGVGGAGAAACFEELCRGGVTRIVRAGTAGGMQDHIVDGALVIAAAAVRDDGYSAGVVPVEFPAVADRRLTAALAEAAPDAHEGIVLTSAVFYPHPVLGSNLEKWQRAGVVAVEMEAASLFVVAALHGVAAGAVLAVDGNPLRHDDTEMTGYDPHRRVVAEAVERALAAALTAITG